MGTWMNVPPFLGKAVTDTLGRSRSLGLPTMKPALLEPSFLTSIGKELGPHHRVLIQAGTA